MADNTTYSIGGVEAKEGTPLTKDQLRAIQVDKKNNPNKQYPEWVDKEYAARKEEVSAIAGKPIVAATGRVPSRSKAPKTEVFAPKAQKEANETPVLAPKVAAGLTYSDVFPKNSNIKIETGLNYDGSRSLSTTVPTGEQVVTAENTVYDRITAGNVEDQVNVETTSQSAETAVPIGSSAERAGGALGIPPQYQAFYAKYKKLPPNAPGKIIDGVYVAGA
jgi:hypothetical protein